MLRLHTLGTSRYLSLQGLRCARRRLKPARTASVTDLAITLPRTPLPSGTPTFSFSTSSGVHRIPWVGKSYEEWLKLPEPNGTDPIRNIRICFHHHMNKKWDFLIYRCDYKSD